MQGFKEQLKQWDVSFWAERLREAKFNITDEELRPYFALPNVLKGLFQVGYLLPPHHIARPLCCIPILLHAHCVAFMSCCIPIILRPHHAASPSCCIPSMLHQHHAASPLCCIFIMLHQLRTACCVLVVLPCCVAASSCRIKLMYRVSFCMLAASHNHFHLVLFTRPLSGQSLTLDHSVLMATLTIPKEAGKFTRDICVCCHKLRRVMHS